MVRRRPRAYATVEGGRYSLSRAVVTRLVTHIRTRTPGLLIRRLCCVDQRPGHLAAGQPRWFSLARVVFPCCAALYGQNQALRRTAEVRSGELGERVGQAARPRGRSSEDESRDHFDPITSANRLNRADSR